ncbi:MAG: DUF190 domain-containing protein [Pseudomonadota bacterium]|nr:DUF190 domain-containing protein [Pseudomonadota bacterium]
MSEFTTRGNTTQYQWLLESAGRMGLSGGTAFKTLAGFGRDQVHRKIFHQVLITSNVPVIVQFIGTETDIDRVVNLLVKEKISVFFTKLPIEYEILEGAY